ncbi:hypothetical protein KV102_15250 [Mumia sp. zg.B53]|uniref:hypothetical protein n=1 Tax=unclassified Mumia TaxID=2621872 RepID=UPI001C6E60A1|nr:MULTISPECIES: hypothetical protein [unclassified Mumia]MBW9208239.1 hypothetical protein [Mumia sp. zg.B21]MBW9216195.1 hypothetical protein [Mumia sp. zg.B53]
MRPPALAVVAAAGRARPAMLALVTAPVVALLLIAASIARIDPRADASWVSYGPTEHGFSNGGGEVLLAPLTDPGTRGGVLFAILLMTVPLLVLLRQAVRLGSSARDRRYASLQVAGATRQDLVRWAALEVVGPTAVGVVLGFGLWQLSRYTLGWPRFDPGGAGGLVPTETGPAWWALIIVLLVITDAAVVGARAGGRSADAWFASKALPRPPGIWRPVMLLLVVVAVPVLSLALFVETGIDSQVVMIPVIALLIVALAAFAPWFGWRIARAVAVRTNRVETLLAARRLSADPRPAARAAATAGAAALACSVAIGLGIDTRAGGNVDTSFTVALLACLAAIVASMGIIAIAIVVRSAEAVAERRREISSLVATGVPAEVVTSSLAVEARLVALPVTVVGAVIGTLSIAALSSDSGAGVATLVGLVATIGLMVLALHLANRLTRSVVRGALTAENLRTE